MPQCIHSMDLFFALLLFLNWCLFSLVWYRKAQICKSNVMEHSHSIAAHLFCFTLLLLLPSIYACLMLMLIYILHTCVLFQCVEMVVCIQWYSVVLRYVWHGMVFLLLLLLLRCVSFSPFYSAWWTRLVDLVCELCARSTTLCTWLLAL